ncbi:MAG: hypothetical protein BWY69_01017 [Planctomycetes bacterium ADurb.Bin401]|nr:MAG: hypothetical protein BWY69_01017 [Planctomycetes bacterium ADurb.Bin401]
MSRFMIVSGYTVVFALICLAVPQTALLHSIESPDFSNQTPVLILDTIGNNRILVVQDANKVIKKIAGVELPQDEISKQKCAQFFNNLLKCENVYIVARDNDYNSVNVYRFPDNMFVNIEIIRQGYGLASCEENNDYAEQFQQFEMFARQARKGIWAAPAVITATISDSNIVPANTDKTIVYVTKSGTKYHRQGCRFLSKSSIPLELKEAKNKYSPCRVCKPQE